MAAARQRPGQRRPAFGLLLLLIAGTAFAPTARADHLIVRFASEGPYALDACAESLFREERAFASASRSHSTSLDEVHARAGVRRIRALFRRPDGRPLAGQRARLGARIGAARSRAVTPRTASDPLPDLAHVYGVEIADPERIDEALSLFGDDPHVVWVQRDHTHRLDDVASPDDPYFHSSGSWGQAFSDLWGLHRIRAPEVWATSTGAGVVVAVVDTGVDYTHPDIADNIWVNPGEDLDGNGRVDASDWNGIDDDANGFVDDLRGFDFANSVDADRDGFYDGPGDVGDPDPFDDGFHGTHVAGTIAALADNGLGIVGVAPGARIMALKGFTAAGVGRDSDLWRAVLYAGEMGARVVNNSWSCSPPCPRNPLAEEIVRLVREMGVVVVTSAGNRQADVVSNSPENTRDVITVASSGEDDMPSASFTNFGWGVDVAAPGGGPSTAGVYVSRRNILSLRSSADPDPQPFAVDGQSLRLSGTSMSAPHVAGAAALLLAAFPEADYETIRRLIRLGAADLGPPGPDFQMGAGRLDVASAFARHPLPDMIAALDGPRAGSVLRPGPPQRSAMSSTQPDHDRGEKSADRTLVEIRGSAFGRDMKHYQLTVGQGNEPESWSPVAAPQTRTVADDVLGRWDITEATEGTWVIRLKVEAFDGTVYDEFIPVSLERNTFAAISPPGASATQPDVDGRGVAWRSQRGAAAAAITNGDLYLSDFSDLRHQAVETGSLDAEAVSMSWSPAFRSPTPRHRRPRSPVFSWNVLDPGTLRRAGFGCRLDPTTGECPAFALASGADDAAFPVSAVGRIFWLADDGRGGRRVVGCTPEPGSPDCARYDLGLPPGRRGGLSTDGHTLSWTEYTGGIRPGLCVVDPVTGHCPARVLAEAVSPLSEITASGRLVAWVEFAFGREQPLLLCEFDPATGACPPIEVTKSVDDPTPQLSGGRLVWDGRLGDEARDVFYCEYDRHRRRCPVQRLTAEMGDQSHSDISGHRVVWQDERLGPSTIFSTTLPHFAHSGPDERRVRVGRELAIRVRVRAGEAKDAEADAALALRVESLRRLGTDLVPVPLDALGARFDDRGRGRALLQWRPRREDVGEVLFTVEAETPGGLVARRTYRVVVEDRRRAKAPERFVQRRNH